LRQAFLAAPHVASSQRIAFRGDDDLVKDSNDDTALLDKSERASTPASMATSKSDFAQVPAPDFTNSLYKAEKSAWPRAFAEPGKSTPGGLSHTYLFHG
jgi:hypothetical protein